MQSEDLSIHFSTELFHKPVKHVVPDLQRLYYVLSQSGAGAYENTDFTVPGQPRFHTKRGRKSHSVAVFLPDRLAIVEEWADVSLPQFLDKVAAVSRQALLELSITAFTMQAVTLRSTCVLTHFDNAGQFLLDHACQQAGRVTPFFQRPIGVAGLRFVLPETPEHPGVIHVTIEPFRNSPNEIFIEVKGIYKGEPLDIDSLERPLERIESLRAFVTDNIYPYLNQFDVPLEDRA